MVWVRLDDAILDNPKVIRVGPIGFALHVAAMTWCGRNCTDGFIPEAKAKQTLSTTWTTAEADDGKEQIWELAATSKHAGFEGHEVVREAIRLLVSVGLWHEDFDARGNFGYRLHDYLEYNPSRAEIQSKSEKRAAAGRVGGKRSASTRQANPKQTRSKTKANSQAKTKPEPEPEPQEEDPPTPFPDGRPRDPCGDTFRPPPGERPDVLEVVEAFKRATGLHGYKFRGPHCEDAKFVAERIGAYSLDECLTVARQCMNDRMVTGKADENGQTHKTIRYVFGNHDAFVRILHDGSERERKTGAKSVTEQLAAVKARSAS